MASLLAETIWTKFEKLGYIQGRQNGFQSGGAMEHGQVLSATTGDQPEKLLNSPRPKSITCPVICFS